MRAVMAKRRHSMAVDLNQRLVRESRRFQAQRLTTTTGTELKRRELTAEGQTKQLTRRLPARFGKCIVLVDPGDRALHVADLLPAE